MYAVSPQVEAAWCALLQRIAEYAEIEFTYRPYPAPQPLEALWSDPDLGCALMCGFPIALGLAAVTPLASPVPSPDWAQGQALYRSDLIIRKDAAFKCLDDSFGARAGWTVEHSHSGFNAFRHHLMRLRTPSRPQFYGAMQGQLVTARRILDEVVAGTIDIGPLDAYWHHLLRLHRPELCAPIRVLASTDLAPMPAFVAGPKMPADTVTKLKAAFARAHQQPWFAEFADSLQILRFETVEQETFAPTLKWHREALDAGYPYPA